MEKALNIGDDHEIISIQNIIKIERSLVKKHIIDAINQKQDTDNEELEYQLKIDNNIQNLNQISQKKITKNNENSLSEKDHPSDVEPCLDSKQDKNENENSSHMKAKTPIKKYYQHSSQESRASSDSYEQKNESSNRDVKRSDESNRSANNTDQKNQKFVSYENKQKNPITTNRNQGDYNDEKKVKTYRNDLDTMPYKKSYENKYGQNQDYEQKHNWRYKKDYEPNVYENKHSKTNTEGNKWYQNSKNATDSQTYYNKNEKKTIMANYQQKDHNPKHESFRTKKRDHLKNDKINSENKGNHNTEQSLSVYQVDKANCKNYNLKVQETTDNGLLDPQNMTQLPKDNFNNYKYPYNTNNLISTNTNLPTNYRQQNFNYINNTQQTITDNNKDYVTNQVSYNQQNELYNNYSMPTDSYDNFYRNEYHDVNSYDKQYKVFDKYENYPQDLKNHNPINYPNFSYQYDQIMHNEEKDQNQKTYNTDSNSFPKENYANDGSNCFYNKNNAYCNQQTHLFSYQTDQGAYVEKLGDKNSLNQNQNSDEIFRNCLPKNQSQSDVIFRNDATQDSTRYNFN